MLAAVGQNWRILNEVTAELKSDKARRGVRAGASGKCRRFPASGEGEGRRACPVALSALLLLALDRLQVARGLSRRHVLEGTPAAAPLSLQVP